MRQDELLSEIDDFLKSLKLSNYEIRVYLELVQTDETLNARNLSLRAEVPSGRIYEVLEELNQKGLVEIQQSRPKLYKAISPNSVFQSLINQLKAENKKRIADLYVQATVLESKIDKSKFWVKQEPSGIFWSTAFGAEPVMSLVTKRINELHEEYLMTAFLTEDTLRVLPYGKSLFMGILNAIKRGVKVKILWSFEFDERPLSDEQKEKNYALYYKLLVKLENLYGISHQMGGLKVRFVHRKIPTYYDIFDKNRVLIKLQNPVKPSQVFACLNVLDPNLAEQLREKYFALWLHEAHEHDGSV